MKQRKRRPARPVLDLTKPFPARQITIRTIGCSANGGFVGKYRKGRFQWILAVPEGVKQRDLYCWIFAGKRRVGAVAFIEYQPHPFIEDMEFWRLMDGVSHTAMEVADILLGFWDDPLGEVTPYGSVILIDRLWVAPRFATSGQWAKVVNAILAKEYRRRSLVLLKAYPLDRDDEGGDELWHLRQRALMRHYRRLLGVQPLPGEAGREGWMYAIPSCLLDIVSRPAVRPS